MATYAIGDIQGCYEPLMGLLDKVRFDPHVDQLCCVGDLVNRGPHSLKVLRFLKTLGDRAIILLGNHDLHFIAVAKGYQALRPNDTFQDVLDAADCDELVEWLLQCRLAYYDQANKAFLVHAGLYPEWSMKQALSFAAELEAVLQGDQCDAFLKVMYGNEPDCWDAKLTGADRSRFLVNAFTRMRFCKPDGTLNLTAKGAVADHPDLKPWFDFPLQLPSDVNIVFGHWAALNGVADGDHVFAIDTGCAWGYRLTALRLEDMERFSDVGPET